MSKVVKEILASQRSLFSDEESFTLSLYYALDLEDKFYFYTAAMNQTFIVQLMEFYINSLAYVEIYGFEMHTSIPIHILKFKQPFNATFSFSTAAIYSNGAICIDQELNKDMIIHVWIDKKTVELYSIPKPEDLNQV